jgi:DNA polymerase-1
MKLVIADYNAMELRAVAVISHDTAMLADQANGVDLHRRQAADTLGIPPDQVNRQQRDAAKPIAFSTIYGAGRRGIAASAWANYDLVLSEEDAETARRAFLTRYPNLAAWMDRNHAEANQQGSIAIGSLGRVIEAAWEQPRLPDGRYNWRRGEEAEDPFAGIDDDSDDRAHAVPVLWRPVLKRTLCCNAPVQGACAEAAMLALTKIDAALAEANIAGGPVLFVHDEIVLEVPEADATRASTLLVEAMTQAFAVTFPGAPLNGLVEVKIRNSWGEPPAAIGAEAKA